MKESYKKLFKLLIDKEMKKTEFAKKIGIGQNTLSKLSKNENVSMEILIKICEGLDCKLEDIVEFVKDED